MNSLLQPLLACLGNTALSVCLGMCFAITCGAQSEHTATTIKRPDAGLLFYAKADFATETAAIRNPSITGGFFQIIWSEVEKEDGIFDWSDIDSWIEPWVAADKYFALRIMWSTSGNWPKPYYKTPTPQWVWDAGAKFAYHEPSETEMPLIWDPVYMKHAFEFMRAVERRYGHHPNLLFVDITPGAETNPYRFGTIDRTDPAFRSVFSNVQASDGRSYSDDLWMETLRDWILGSKHIFKSVPPLVTLNVAGMGRDAPDKSALVGEMCVENGYYVGQNGIRKNAYLHDSARRRAMASWAPRTRLFFEMVAGTGRRTGTLMEVMQEAERISCHFLNVYPRDVLRGTRGQSDFDPTYEEALIYGAEAMQTTTTVPSGVSEVNGETVFTYEQESDLRELERLACESRLGPDRRGRFTHYFRTETDRSVQPAGMFVPSDLDPSKSYPLVIQLHGIGPKRIAGVRAGWPGMRDHEWIDPELDVIYAQAYARQNSGYRGIAEAEVLQIYRMVSEAYPVDPDRIYLMGHSMGGGGTLNIAFHHPDLFAGIIAIDSALGRRSVEEITVPAWLEARRNTHAVHHFAENAYNLPVRLHSAGGPMRKAQVELYDRMHRKGCRDAKLKVHEGMPHHFAADLPYSTFIPEILQHSRVVNPERVKFKTNTLRYAKAYWTEVLGLERSGQFGRLDAHRDADKIEIQTHNLTRLKIDLHESPTVASIHINGSEVTVPTGAQHLVLERRQGSWRLTDQENRAGQKRPGLQGPVADAFASPFLLVYGDENDMALAQAETDAIRNPAGSRRCVAGDFPVKSASEVTPQDIARYNLIMFGNAESNSIIRRIQRDLPIQLEAESVRDGRQDYPEAEAVLIHPNPLNPERYVVVWSGRVLSRKHSAKSAFPSLTLLDLPDFLITRGGAPVSAGFFNHAWKLPEHSASD